MGVLSEAAKKALESGAAASSSLAEGGNEALFVGRNFVNELSHSNAFAQFVTAGFADDDDRLMKIGRRVIAYLADFEKSDSSAVKSNDTLLEARLLKLVTDSNCLDLESTNNKKVPKKIFGKTGLNISVLTCGGMRIQQKWGPAITSIDQVTKECQDSLIATIRRALAIGINHFETARMYGCSELQFGEAFKFLFESGEVKREDIILQTKVAPMDDREAFRSTLDKSLELLEVFGHFDLFAFHGVNRAAHMDQIFGKANCWDVAQEYVASGKIKHIGFSTHGQPALISKMIATEKFEFVNLHYGYFGSYVSSGTGDFGGNLQNIVAANKQNMGVFIISPGDKAGKLFVPSNKLTELCMPDLEPLQFNALWLIEHSSVFKQVEGLEIHTMTVGAARPSDFDEYYAVMQLCGTEGGKKMVSDVQDRLNAARNEALGEAFAATWYKGLPGPFDTAKGIYFSELTWLGTIIKAFGMVSYSADRYVESLGNTKNWDEKKSDEDNKKGWGYCPGASVTPGTDYSEELKDCPEENLAQIKELLELVHAKCTEKDTSSLTWSEQSGYDARVSTEFCRRAPDEVGGA